MDFERRLVKNRQVYEQELERAHFDYEYPDGLDLHPKSQLHAFLVSQVEDMAMLSHSALEGSKEQWRKLDTNLSTYVYEDDVDRAVRGSDPRKPTNVVVPMLFASQEVFITYLANAFLKDPIYRLQGRGSKRAKLKAILLERVLSKQHKWFKEALHLTTMFRDAMTYGFGVASPLWRKQRAVLPFSQHVTDLLAAMLQESGLDAEIGDTIFGDELRVIAEGNELINVDPYNVLLDARATVNKFNDSQYFGYIERDNIMNMLQHDGDPETGVFNAKYAKILAGKASGASAWYTQTDTRNELFGKPQERMLDGDGDPVKPDSTIDTIHLYVNIVPKEWNLSDKDEPQLWKFALSGDKVITECRPVNLWHGRLPAVICGPNTSGYDISPVSHLALAYGMQHFMDFLVKSHVDNVRKALNDMLVVNPAMIEIEDVLNPGPGKIIRTREHAYMEQPLQNHIHQLAVQDVTAQNVTDSHVMMQFMQKTLGTSDVTMGDLSGLPERPTEAGVNAAQVGALSRLQLTARKIGMQAIQELAFQEGYNTLQFMGEDVAVSILGEFEEQLRREFGLEEGESEMTVRPEMLWDLDMGFEVDISDGSLPQQSDLGAMTEIVRTALGVEGAGAEMLGGLNMQNLFLQWARKSGFENVHEFMKAGGDVQAQVMPDEQVQQQAQAGNLVPTGQALGV